MDHPSYAYKDFMSDEFPFKIEVRSPRNYNEVVHSHEHLQLCYIAAGSCAHWVHGKEAVAVKGDFFAIPPFLEHLITPIESMDFMLIQIDFMPFFINENLTELSKMDQFVDFAYIQPLMTAEAEILPKLQLAPIIQRKVEDLIESMRTELAERQEGYMLSIKADLLKLLILAGREFDKYRRQGGRMQKTISSHRQAFYSAIEYIEVHYQDDLRLEDMAEKAHMAPSYFSSVFKLMKGATFIEYLNDIRIRQAMDCLLRTDLSVTEISFQVGYNNIGHFNKMFKKVTGVTPTQYRKLTSNVD